MDELNIIGLSVSTKIGVHRWEQAIHQRLLIDINIPLDLSECKEDLKATIDYDLLCQLVTTHVESNSFQLIETVANQVAQLVKERFQVKRVLIKVAKPQAIKNASNVSVTVSR